MGKGPMSSDRFLSLEEPCAWFMLCCCCIEISIIYLKSPPYFHFALGPTYYVAGPSSKGQQSENEVYRYENFP